MSLGLAVITLVSLLFAVFALSDIYSGAEANLNLEWIAVRVAFLFTLMFVAIATTTILKLSRQG